MDRDQSPDLDWPLSAVALLAALLSGYLLSQPATLRPVGWTPPTPQAGTLTFQVGEVRRRPAGTLIWYPAGHGDPVFVGDALFVAPASSAMVDLEGGAQLELDQNTLVVLEPPGRDQLEPRRVAIHKGSLSGSSGAQALSLEAHGTVAALQPNARAELSLEATGAQIAVRQGEVSVQGPEGPSRLGPRESGRFLVGGALVRTQAPPVTLQSPAPRHRALAHTPLVFSWTPRAPGASLQLSADRTFESPLPQTGADGRLSLGLAPGVYWWRVVDAEGRPLSERRGLTLLENVSPQTISPARDERYPESTVELRWSEVEGAAGYQLEVAAEPGFARVLFQWEATGARHRWVGAPEGDFWWRVRATIADHRGQWSPPSPFRILLQPLPAAPVLSEPEIELPSRDAGLL
ncbi:MAG: hypothetical protein M3Y59_25985 [Myxococcota bacterium]|nr:hypothetical protein [Myxococcota bacterium]